MFLRGNLLGMRLTHLVNSAGCASKLGPTQLGDILKKLPPQTHPDLLVGFSSRDDAGLIRVPGLENRALVQTMDFFTPVTDDPYAYGQIAAANALSDVYAMGGTPHTVMNIVCFDPSTAPDDVWVAILKGMADKTAEAGAIVVGGHSVIDKEPKFGMSVTGWVDLDRTFTNSAAKVGQSIWLSKPVGVGIANTAAKYDDASSAQIAEAVKTMSTLNKEAMLAAQAANVRCATDVTGFGLVGHLWNIARESQVQVHLEMNQVPLLDGIQDLIAKGCTTGGGKRNRMAVEGHLEIDPNVPEWLIEVACDPQTSGGLAVCSDGPVVGSVCIGRIESGNPAVFLH